tara:strand:- start:31 stop:273 length:243 start_codon:yes stop_codon:yes gene_type:complete
MAGTKNTIISVLMMIVIVLLFNYKKKANQVDDLNIKISEINDHFLDLQSDYENITNEVIRLEYENQILGSYAAEKEIKYD